MPSVSAPSTPITTRPSRIPIRSPAIPQPRVEPARRPSPAQIVGGVHRSSRVRKVAFSRNFTIEQGWVKEQQDKEQRAARRRASAPTVDAPAGPPVPEPHVPLDGGGQQDIADIGNGPLETEEETNLSYIFAGTAKEDLPGHKLPRDIPDALNGPEKEFWAPSIDRELQGFIDNDVYDVIPILDGVKPITSWPVFRYKVDQNGVIID
ncbi:hypothetical protein FISHEDRAFT_42329, partial [Fistulina hepatica ATCC 64428]